MTFEFLIACHITSETDVHKILTELLFEALEANQDEFDEDSIDRMIQISHRRPGDEFVDDDGETMRHTLFGFTLELPEIGSAESVVDDFAKSLSASAPIFHAVKFEDTLFKDELAQLAAEIFALEMKLRRVLSFIYLHAYQREDTPYDLLKDDQISPMTKESNKEYMESVTENQFFHMTFSDYVSLNQRRQLQVPNILHIIRDSERYDVLRDELMRIPIDNEEDNELLNDLKRLMDPIERMRNCVAHNRKPSRRNRQSYPQARSDLENRLDSYLVGLEC